MAITIRGPILERKSVSQTTTKTIAATSIPRRVETTITTTKTVKPQSQHHSTSCRRRSQPHNHACMRTRPYAHAYARTRADTRTHTYAHTRTHTRTPTHTHVRTHTRTPTRAYTRIPPLTRHADTGTHTPPIGRVPTGKPRGRCDSSSDAGCDWGLLWKNRSFL